MQDFEIFGRQIHLGWGKNFFDHYPMTKLKKDETAESSNAQQKPNINLTESTTRKPER